MAVEELAKRIVETASIDGMTFSGGEPFAQAGTLGELVDAVRQVRDLSVMSYSGYTLEWLRRNGNSEQRGLLERLDILVDGPYRADLHASLRWRGSSNQRVHLLTTRHTATLLRPDESAGLEVSVDAESMSWAGVPPTRGFRGALERRLFERGVDVEVAMETYGE